VGPTKLKLSILSYGHAKRWKESLSTYFLSLQLSILRLSLETNDTLILVSRIFFQFYLWLKLPPYFIVSRQSDKNLQFIGNSGKFKEKKGKVNQ